MKIEKREYFEYYCNNNELIFFYKDQLSSIIMKKKYSNEYICFDIHLTNGVLHELCERIDDYESESACKEKMLNLYKKMILIN